MTFTNPLQGNAHVNVPLARRVYRADQATQLWTQRKLQAGAFQGHPIAETATAEM